MIVATRDLVAQAVDQGSAILAFNVITLEHVEGIVAGLAAAGRPGILQVSENAVRYHGSMAPLLAACREQAAAAQVPVSVHLDHMQDPDLIDEALSLAERMGVSSIMIDAAHLPDAENIATTARRALQAHELNLWVEAELGEIGGKGGAHTPGVRTDPDQARDFVAATGVDGLAVAVGSEHAMTQANAQLDIELIGRLDRRVPVPLVLHGSSGVGRQALADAVAAGIRKVNIGTALNVEFTDAVRSWLVEHDGVDPRRYLVGARGAVADAVAGAVSAVS